MDPLFVLGAVLGVVVLGWMLGQLIPDQWDDDHWHDRWD